MNDLSLNVTHPNRTPQEKLELFIKTIEFKSADQVTGSDIADALRIVQELFGCAPLPAQEQPLTPGL